MQYHQIYHQYIIIQLNMTQSIFTGLLYDSCLKPGSCKDPRRQAVITKSNGLSSVRKRSNGMQVPNEQRRLEPVQFQVKIMYKKTKHAPNTPPKNCTSMCSLFFALGLSLPRYHCILQDPNLCSRIAVNVMSRGHHLPKENLQTNLLQVPSGPIYNMFCSEYPVFPIFGIISQAS